MFRIVKKERLNPTVTKMVIDAPFIAKKAEPGQFIILRALEDSERIPLTIADYDRQGGTVTIIYQIVGGSTMELDTLEEGQTLHDFVGPLGVATHTEGLKKVAVVGGGVGCGASAGISSRRQSASRCSCVGSMRPFPNGRPSDAKRPWPAPPAPASAFFPFSRR